jgi:iron complex transport system ATP-binding protein
VPAEPSTQGSPLLEAVLGRADGHRPAPGRSLVLRLAGVSIWVVDARSGARTDLLAGIDWEVAAGEHWALLGPNGAGKTTLLSLAAAVRHPSAGSAEVLGARLGRVDLRALRAHVGVVAADAGSTPPRWLSVEDVVLTGVGGTVQLDEARAGAAERERARALLAALGCARLAARPYRTCSRGEQQRVRIARALMPAPRLLLLDEPAAGLDLVARERLLSAMDGLAALVPALATVTVTHHVEEVPASATHALLLRSGRAVASGPVAEVLTGEHLSACFGLPIQVARHGRRWAARAGG